VKWTEKIKQTLKYKLGIIIGKTGTKKQKQTKLDCKSKQADNRTEKNNWQKRKRKNMGNKMDIRLKSG
jgi:hypothetical protein